MTADRWIALLSSLGSLAAAAVALIALFEMRRQRRNTNLVALFLPDCDWTCAFKLDASSSVTITGFSTPVASDRGHPCIEIVNAGRSAAITIEARCSYDFPQSSQLLTGYRDERQLAIEAGSDFVSFKTVRTQIIVRRESDGYTKVDFLPFCTEAGPGRARLSLPIGYLILFEEYLKLLRELTEQRIKRPRALSLDPADLFSLTFEVSHRDIEGRQYATKFVVAPKLVTLSENEARGFWTVTRKG